VLGFLLLSEYSFPKRNTMLQDTLRKTLLPLDKRLKKGDGLHNLMQRVERDNQLAACIRDITQLPENSFFVVSSEGACLLLNCTSASVATQLRMMNSDILQQLQKKQAVSFKELKVQVRPMYQKKRIKHAALRKISKANASLLRETA